MSKLLLSEYVWYAWVILGFLHTHFFIAVFLSNEWKNLKSFKVGGLVKLRCKQIMDLEMFTSGPEKSRIRTKKDLADGFLFHKKKKNPLQQL